MNNWKKTLGVSTLAAGLLFGSFAPYASAQKPSTSEPQTEQFVLKDSPAPIDLGVANDERLIEYLIEQGKISNSLSPAAKEKALKDYLKKRASKSVKEDNGELHHETAENVNATREKLRNSAVLNGRGQKKGHQKEIDPIQKETWNGDVRSDNVLVLLVEYPDFPAANIIKQSTDMYYDEYTKEHYENMIFGENGYKGPGGEDLISVKQYYEQQSGGSYTIEGEVAGWYQAKHPAAYYGGNDPAPDGSDRAARSLVYEALVAAANDPTVDLGEYDQEDRYDLDGDGNYREPDGLIDHLMVVHSSVGEEAGGGKLGGDAIWSHRWNLGGVATLPGTTAEVGYWGGAMAAYDYTIEPADGAAGVFAHEYGHDLELPDEYDTMYSGAGEPVAYWSIMSSGSWAGDIPGTEPTGFSAWAKEFLQGYVGGNWLSGSTISSKDVTSAGTTVLLDQANDKGTNNDAVRIDLPQKETAVNTPYSGEYEYHSDKGNNLDNSLVTSVDLTNAGNAALTFKAWYEIEVDWDYASVQVKEAGTDQWVAIPGNLTTTTDPHGQNPGHGITGHSDGWVDAEFDLSAYAGKNIDLRINYWTDVAAVEQGFYADDLRLTVDGSEVLFDDAEGEAKFSLEGFKKDTGVFYSEHYYLLEWRNHEGVDEGLKHLRRGASLMEYDEGLLVWYVDGSVDNNWTGIHPGDGFLGVVDAHQETLKWSDGALASTRYQVNDATFGLDKTNAEFLDYRPLGLPGYDFYLRDESANAVPLFDDSFNYLNTGLPDSGRDIPTYGLKFRVLGQADDKSAAKIVIFK
ncbi:immune inhibitor A domain-containing protein [Alkalihalobacillus sp. AL-G]|uniref:immune inhibitor A domain-containing protein n=1 Tax=Alkalihalobacillus sp. AL-G TaxID=2926399 RepID=UPI00272A7A8A|nr:immune inhibitor A domain-containing protein [Alkalihalobacillus sp. AL-G]WLD91864.1 immune inhibitor A [Alkalihalobacillus sp. AL-G]